MGVHLNPRIRGEAARADQALGRMIWAEVVLVQTAADAYRLLVLISNAVRDFHAYLKTCLRTFLVRRCDRGMHPLGRRFRGASFGTVKRVNELFIRGYVVPVEQDIGSWESRDHIPISVIQGVWDMARRILHLHLKSPTEDMFDQ